MNKKILFIVPPFISRKNPYPSIPVLAEYLIRKNVPVEALDVNIEFWNKFINKDNLKTSKDYIVSRFNFLNNKKELNAKEIFEYQRLIMIIYSGNLENDIELFLAPYFPNFYTEKPLNVLHSYFDEFSSNDILESVKHNFFYSDILKDIVKNSITNKHGIVVISIVFKNQVLPGFYLSSLIKKFFPEIHIAIGGPFITIHFNKLNNVDLFKITDSFILNEGEIPLEKLYEEINYKKSPNLYNVPNLIWLNNKKIIFNKTVPPPPMTELRTPAYNILPLNKYFSGPENMIYSFRLSRGCYWQQCSFCRTDLFFCKNYTQPDYNSVFESLLECIEKYNAKNFLFADESAHPDLLEFLSKKIIKHKLDIKWFTHTRFHKSLNRDRFKLFKKANCEYITLGLESYNNRILKLMKKGIDTKLIDYVIKENNGILPLKMYAIIGFPTETEEEFLLSKKYYDKVAKDKLVDSFHFSIFQLTYGSDVWCNYENYGIRKIELNKNQDLLPDIYNFECEGMDRDTVFSLYLQQMMPQHSLPVILNVNNKIVNINFDLKKIRETITNNLSDSFSTSFGKWLENADFTIKKNENVFNFAGFDN